MMGDKKSDSEINVRGAMDKMEDILMLSLEHGLELTEMTIGYTRKFIQEADKKSKLRERSKNNQSLFDEIAEEFVEDYLNLVNRSVDQFKSINRS